MLAVGDSELAHTFTGANLDVLAPGRGLWVPQIDGGWGSVDGTSFSTAQVSGAAALVWGHRDDVVNPQVISYLLRAGASSGSAWRLDRGFGTISVARSIVRKAPADDEWEPNEKTRTASAFACRAGRPCVLNGIAGTTDDPSDIWRVTGGRCAGRPKISPARSVIVRCTTVGRSVFVTVTPRRPNVAYRVTL